ncbi:hypothetical protein L596_004684 [Steinernema carpocapsae]|uniref:Uncharacterized protein n=1 Tax=Steinernema carpocapsae TaxID=34508 RepID=A0A4V6I876_STECR|nr:hypothetical protein L596_004684 [Steinernema carpocapsae]
MCPVLAADKRRKAPGRLGRPSLLPTAALCQRLEIREFAIIRCTLEWTYQWELSLEHGLFRKTQLNALASDLSFFSTR